MRHKCTNIAKNATLATPVRPLPDTFCDTCFVLYTNVNRSFSAFATPKFIFCFQRDKKKIYLIAVAKRNYVRNKARQGELSDDRRTVLG